MTDRDIALRVVWHYLGKPYLWGGDDPRGFDCSGLVIEALQACGRFPVGRDTTAEGLRKMYPESTGPDRPGDLVFWLRDGKAFHVGMLVDPPQFYIGAEGGGPSCINPDVALERNAYVRVRPVASRGLPVDRVFATPLYDDSLGPVAPDDGG